MGYFILPESDDVRDLLVTAKANIELYLKNPEDHEYLLEDFALTYIDKALKNINNSKK